MRESDHDCVQSHEDFTYTNPAVDPATPAPAPDDSITVEVVKKKQVADSTAWAAEGWTDALLTRLPGNPEARSSERVSCIVYSQLPRQ
ncbi:hypothetical protein JFT91_23045 [Pseudomonas sp. TH08]|uniref:hypothetical protein n=1 Tax=Pseudomonas sp. TH08 TaxID=2796374 RepID=UPI001914A8A3|nr:hypothetical protein [Pseudomonas sp. TH08]MBK5535415.1 hypothetical protein [Pseudomonas sp. TH08]